MQTGRCPVFAAGSTHHRLILSENYAELLPMSHICLAIYQILPA